MARPSRKSGKKGAAIARKTSSAKGRGSAKTKRPVGAAIRSKRSIASGKELKEAREQQAATAEILKVIARSPDDVQPVFEAIAASANRLIGGHSAAVYRFIDGVTYLNAFTPTTPEADAVLKNGFPMPVSSYPLVLQNALNGETVQIPDTEAGEEVMIRIARARGFRSIVFSPLMHRGAAIGMISVSRRKPGMFADQHIRLLRTFADQAVIAIENARLFNETQEALAQQTASSEILKVISQSPTDVQPVFDAIVLNAVKLLRCDRAFIQRCDSRTYSSLAAAGPEGPLPLAMRGTLPLDPDASFPARAMVTKKTLHVPDWSAVELPEQERRVREALGYNSALYMPLLRNDECVGLLGVAGVRPNTFGAKEIALAESFRDQALIAIENTRLFNETKEALAYQIGSSNVLRVIASSPTAVDPVLKAIVESARELCEAIDAVVLLRDAEHLRFSAHSGPLPVTVDKWPIGRGWTAGRAFVDQKPVHVHDMLSEEGAEFPDARAMGQTTGSDIHTVLSVPLLRGNESIGAILLRRAEVRPFNDKQVKLLSTFADQAVIAIQNTRQFNETQEALERQTATADILKVIAGSPSDVQPVFQAIAERSNRLIGGLSCAVYSIVDDVMHLMAFTRSNPEADAALQASFPRPLSEAGWADRIRRGEIVEIADAQTEWAVPDLRDLVRLRGFRGQLFVPLLLDGATIGIISVTRREPGKFAPHHVQLLQTFADQAVIAIGNVRLFDEVQARTRELSESLQQQTATADVLKIISRSAFDIQAVFDTLTASAVDLLGMHSGTICVRDGEVFRYRSAAGAFWTEELWRYLQEHPAVPVRETAAGRVILSGRIEQIPDIFDDPEYAIPMKALTPGHTPRAMLGVPLLGKDGIEGAMVLSRQEPGPFTQREVDILRTFADQAVIAIQNARLFEQVQTKSRNLEESLQQQTATADVLKVISRSTFDLQTVLDTLLTSAARLCQADHSFIFLRDGDAYRLAAGSGGVPEWIDYLRETSIRPDRGTVAARALLEARTIHIPDVLDDPEYTFLEAQKRGGFRTALGVPLLREGTSIGVMVLTRPIVRPFDGSHIALVTTFADQAVIAIENIRLFESVEARTRELAQSLDELRAAQDRLVQTEKLASLGQLTAGIAHEIKNPLNFVNNFSALSAELVNELDETLVPAPLDQKMRGDVGELTGMLKSNLEKVVQHGKRADSIVKNMLLHSREGSGERQSADINALVGESLNLAYHGARAEKPGFAITLKHDLDPDAGALELYPREITRALLNLISNGFYAAVGRKAETDDKAFEPVLSAATRNLGETVEIRIRDNGAGIPPDVREKMFNPFFTTKPTGEGTGLGLSMTHDIIVKQHGGRIDVETEAGVYTEFIVTLPRGNGTVAR